MQKYANYFNIDKNPLLLQKKIKAKEQAREQFNYIHLKTSRGGLM
jgi:hypothetical protein